MWSHTNIGGGAKAYSFGVGVVGSGSGHLAMRAWRGRA
jgi:hypothetical protein